MSTSMDSDTIVPRLAVDMIPRQSEPKAKYSPPDDPDEEEEWNVD